MWGTRRGAPSHSSPSQGSLGKAGRRPGGHRASWNGVWAEGAEGRNRGVPEMEPLGGGRRAQAPCVRAGEGGGGRRGRGGGRGASFNQRVRPPLWGPPAGRGARMAESGRCPRAQSAREDGALGEGGGAVGTGRVLAVCGLREIPQHRTEVHGEGGGARLQGGEQGPSPPGVGCPPPCWALLACGEVGSWHKAPAEGGVQRGGLRPAPGLRTVWAGCPRAVGRRSGLTPS